MSQVVNLRILGTDLANPTQGTLIGNATLPASQTTPPPAILCYARTFQLATGTFGDVTNPEYVEVPDPIAGAIQAIARFYPAPIVPPSSAPTQSGVE